MTTDPLELLACLLESAPGPIRGAAFGAPIGLQPLIGFGVLIPKGHVDTVTCVECDAVHLAPVVRGEGGLVSLCDRLGCEFVIEEDLTQYEVNVAALVGQLSGAIASDKPHELPGCFGLWSLGPITEGDHTITSYFVPRIADYQHLVDIANIIRGRSHGHRDGTSLVHVGSLDCSPGASPSGFSIIQLKDIGTLSASGGLKIDIGRLFELTVPSWRRKPASRGRPANARNALLRIIEQLEDQERLPEGLNAAANMAIKEFGARNQDAVAPGLTTAKGAVRTFREGKM